MKKRPKNHPKKGSSIKVEPIRDTRDIKTIKKLLTGHPRNYCLFVLEINTALRAGDLVSITVGQVRHLEVREQKTGKIRRVTLNKAAVKAIKNLLASRELADDDFLFTGTEVREGLGRWIRYYNQQRPHSQLQDRTPDEAYDNKPLPGYTGMTLKKAA